METMTVKRKDTGNPKIINVGDFDPAKHELFDAQEDPKKMKKEALAAWLVEQGVEVPEGANKGDLIALIPE